MFHFIINCYYYCFPETLLFTIQHLDKLDQKYVFWVNCQINK